MKSGRYDNPVYANKPFVEFIKWDEGSNLLTVQARNTEVMEKIYQYLINEYAVLFTQVGFSKNKHNQIEVVAGDTTLASQDALDVVKALVQKGYIGKALNQRIMRGANQQETCILF